MFFSLILKAKQEFLISIPLPNTCNEGWKLKKGRPLDRKKERCPKSPVTWLHVESLVEFVKMLQEFVDDFSMTVE